MIDVTRAFGIHFTKNLYHIYLLFHIALDYDSKSHDYFIYFGSAACFLSEGARNNDEAIY